MSPYRINTFLTEMVQTTINGEIQNNPQTVFKLDDSNITSVELVEVLQDNGSWQVITTTRSRFLASSKKCQKLQSNR